VTKLLPALLVLCAACKPAPSKKSAATPSTKPQTRATVLTIETTIQPANKKFVHSITIANDRARSGDELDHWRLFDLKANTVSYVDDIGKTIQTKSLASIVKQHRESLAAAMPEYIPRAQAQTSGGKITITAGGYSRTLTITQHPLIPPQLFSMMVASDPSASPYSPMMRTADETLMNVRGFPMNDHAELALDGKKLSIDRNVVKVEQKNIDASWLELPREFAVNPQPASSPPAGRSTPAAGSRSSATARRSP